MIEFIADHAVLRLLLLAIMFALVAAGAYVVASAMTARSIARQRLADSAHAHAEIDHLHASLRVDQSRHNWQKIVDRIEKSGLSLVNTNDESLRQKLAAAGYPEPYAPRVYTLIRLVLVIALPVLTLAFFWWVGATPGLVRLYFSVMIAAVLGLYIPTLFVRIRADRRQRELINGFPDSLDLMLVCVEAGLGLDAAFARVGEEIARSHPLLAEHYGAVVLELRAGRSREDALRRMADRAAADEIRAFATLLMQSNKLGSSIAQTLRTYASEMREKRRLRAEEKAHRLPVLLSIPLVACLLPVMIGVLMLPAVIRIVRVLAPAMGGD